LNLTNQIKQKALEIGFDLVGITTADPLDAGQISVFKDWLEKGLAAQMNFFHKNFDKRINPSLLLDGAKSIIVAAVNYKTPGISMSLRAKRSNLQYPLYSKKSNSGRIASFAQYEDYHTFIENNLWKLADFITSVAGKNHRFKICVDSAPLAEKAFAARAGLGFIGKNHLLINPLLGPQLLLGEIITTIELTPDNPTGGEPVESIEPDCRNCDKCIKNCPTGALRPDGLLDANKCISYLTIEHKSDIPATLASKIGNRLFGCEECILACPYQKIAPVCRNKHFKFYPQRVCLDLSEILNLTQESFAERFPDSPLKRIGLERLKRNAKICLQNISNKMPD
jgi:epoxyqueuosine reductase